MRNLIISTIVSLFLFFLMTGIGVAADNDNILDSTDAATASIDFNVSKNITVTYKQPWGFDYLSGGIGFGVGALFTGTVVYLTK